MTTIFLPMEPQPEISIKHDVSNFWAVTLVHSSPWGVACVEAPHKPGDEIEYKDQDLLILKGQIKFIKGIVKSITPIEENGKWVWEIEVE